MVDIKTSAHDMISGMSPKLLDGEFIFATFPEPGPPAALIGRLQASFRESEGFSVIVSRETAAEFALAGGEPMRCITLNVYSSLEGVGLTAAVATALAEAGIPCNMVAAYHHDHAFVPANDADRALAILLDLQAGAAR